MGKDRTLVHKVDGTIPPEDIYATTYQMRNFYQQFADGFFSSLDVMNYIQHQKAVKYMRKGDRVLDVCCGRGLLLPLMRYKAKEIKEYVGVDIEPKNIAEQLRKSGIKKIEDAEEYYPFKITHVVDSCENMTQYLEPESFDVIIYTSAIEHMQRDVGFKSLQECFALLKKTGTMFISCPNTLNKKDPYDTQYAAHLYEWDLDELSSALEEVGFVIRNTWGVVGKVRAFEEYLQTRSPEEQEMYGRFKEYLPSEWLMAFFPLLYPEGAAEVALEVGKTGLKQKKRAKVRAKAQKRSKRGFGL